MSLFGGCAGCIEDLQEQQESVNPYMGTRGAYRDTRDFEDPSWVNRAMLGDDTEEMVAVGVVNPEEDTAYWLVADFCQGYSTRVIPSEEELRYLQVERATLRDVEVAKACSTILSFCNGDLSWQPRLRVLYALMYFAKADATGPTIAKLTARDSSDILRYLRDEVAECSELARQVLDIAGE